MARDWRQTKSPMSDACQQNSQWQLSPKRLCLVKIMLWAYHYVNVTFMIYSIA